MVCLFNLKISAFDQLDNKSTVVGGNEYSNGGSTKCMITHLPIPELLILIISCWCCSSSPFFLMGLVACNEKVKERRAILILQCLFFWIEAQMSIGCYKLNFMAASVLIKMLAMWP